ncbi:BTAD domain-containing putative transcriptional regulator [Streptomyces sp. AC627_RSS907]|uniref:BTAD domain-containing putative transcriptional regulator n=1 Tax=Streptomyces sp. AC627_RSS907 TaxID=2823684 RepID=UPI001C230CC5|nr:BTAD domain-containing putative transcriptional regulator [Streptomyces sp. AC627_RSS907]
MASLHAHISRLRSALAALTGASLLTTATGYRLVLPDCATDAEIFEYRLRCARETARDGRPHHAVEHLEEALRSWRGLPLTEAAGYAFAEPEADRLSELRREAMELRVLLLLRTGSARAAVEVADALVRDQPLREPSWAVLLRALQAAGRPVEALRRYAEIRLYFAEELGVEPGSALRRIHADLLRDDEEPSGQAAVLADARSRPKPAAPSIPVVGRDTELAVLRSAVEASRYEPRWAVLQGPPGSGRTRLLQEIAELVRAADGTVHWARHPGEGNHAGVVAEGVGALLDETERYPARCGDAAAHPRVWLVDDAEGMTAAEAQRLTALAETLYDVPLLVVVAVTSSMERTSHIHRVLAAFARRNAVVAELAPLTESDVRTLLASAPQAAVHTGPADSARLRRASGGSPALLTALLTAGALPSGPGALVPPTVVHVVNGMLSGVDESTAEVLHLAALTGPDVDVRRLAAVLGLTAAAVRQRLDSALAGGLLTWTAGADGTAGKYSFAGTVVRDALLGTLTPGRRQTLEALIDRHTRRTGARPVCRDAAPRRCAKGAVRLSRSGVRRPARTGTGGCGGPRRGAEPVSAVSSDTAARAARRANPVRTAGGGSLRSAVRGYGDRLAAASWEREVAGAAAGGGLGWVRTRGRTELFAVEARERPPGSGALSRPWTTGRSEGRGRGRGGDGHRTRNRAAAHGLAGAALYGSGRLPSATATVGRSCGGASRRRRNRQRGLRACGADGSMGPRRSRPEICAGRWSCRGRGRCWRFLPRWSERQDLRWACFRCVVVCGCGVTGAGSGAGTPRAGGTPSAFVSSSSTTRSWSGPVSPPSSTRSRTWRS